MWSVAMIGHVAAGMVALAAFWSAAMLRKGSTAHRRAGRIYLLAMVGILASIPLIAAALLMHGEYLQVVRLPYVMLIASTAVWVAWRAIRDRLDPARFSGRVFRLLAFAMIASGVVFFGVGVRAGNLMTIGFALVGLVFGGAMLAFAVRGPTGPRWWLAWHLNGVCLLFAATHDSFLSLGLRSLVPQLQGDAMRYLIFYSVLGLAIGARFWLGRKYLASASSGKPANQSFSRVVTRSA